MDSVIIVSCISFCGTIIGTVSGVIVSNKLVNYRIEQLEKKIDNIGCVYDRLTKVETQIKYLENK